MKDILVHVDNGPAAEERLRLVCELARSHGAHLVALYSIEPLPIARYSPWGDPGYSDFFTVDQLQEQYRTAAHAAMGNIEAVFRAEVDRCGISSEWRLVEDVGATAFTRQARYADLTVLGQVDPARPTASTIVPEEIVLSSGRPMLVVPHVGGFERVGRRTLIAWDAGREAARAIGDALPLLMGAEAVTVLSINAAHEIEDDEPGVDLTHHLARHGIKATTARIVAKDSIGDALLSFSADCGADLIVMGAYGHSRTRELLLGGVTRHVLQHMTVPVLMAH